MSPQRSLPPLEPIPPNLFEAHRAAAFSKVGSFDDVDTMDRFEQNDGSQASDTVSSGFESLENGTDDFGRMILQTARDEQWLNNALRSDIQPFRKARTQPRVGLTMENLERNGGLQAAATSTPPRQTHRASSISSVGSDPPMQPPREWGRKGRYSSNWLRRITSPRSDGGTSNGNRASDTRSPAHNSQDAREDVNWSSVAADVPVPSVEPLGSPASINQATPPTARKSNTSLDEIREWELSEDFTMGSIIASTPAVSRNTVLDDIRRREIEILREKAVATMQLERIRENGADDMPPPQPSLRTSIGSNADNPVTTSRKSSISRDPPSRLPIRIGSTPMKVESPIGIKGEENSNSSQDSPVIVVYKGSPNGDASKQGTPAKALPGIARPVHDRRDSHDLLRRLARVASASPSPGRSSTDSKDYFQNPTAVQASESPFGVAHGNEVLENTTTKTTTDRVEITARSNLPVMTKTRFKTESVEPPIKEDPDDFIKNMTLETPAGNSKSAIHNQKVLDPKTPVVTGAWVDTPLPTTRERNSIGISKPISTRKSRSPQKRSNPIINPPTSEGDSKNGTEAATAPAKPSLPSSALASLVSKAKSGDNEDNDDRFGDSTIDSLEDILQPTMADVTSDLDDDTLQGLELPTEQPRSEAERRRQKELHVLHQMNARLRATRTGILDTQRGLKRMGHLAESEAKKPSNSTTIHGQCKHCGCAEHPPTLSPLTAIWIWVKSILIQHDEQRRLKFTWFGLFAILFFIWFITENALCDIYCHPFEADYFEGVDGWPDPDAPRMPFVTITVLFRPFKQLWMPIFRFGTWLFQFVSNVLEMDYGYFFRRAASSSPRSVAQETVLSGYSMMDDDYV